jgi:ABC-type dipeptide/oligopeptide/nickel transport system permease component
MTGCVLIAMVMALSKHLARARGLFAAIGVIHSSTAVRSCSLSWSAPLQRWNWVLLPWRLPSYSVSQLALLPLFGMGACIYLRLNHLILPALVLAAGSVAGYSRYLRGSMLDVIGQDYIRTAHAKGLPPRRVWVGHAARNALIPVATFLGPALTGLLSGAVVTETIFSWPGLGRLAIQSINTFDYPMIMAVTMLGAVATVLGFILSDILYALIDPRIRFS